MPDRRQVAVLGAGLAGLAAAQRLREVGWPVDVYERNSFVGGHASSHEVDGFVFDEGPHVSFTTRSEIQSLFAEAVNHEFLEQDATILNLWQGHWVRHPVQTNLFGLPEDLVTQSVVDFVGAQNGDDRPIETYADWCYAGLGRTLSEEFTFQYTRKYWTTEASNMSTDWVGQRVYRPELEEVVRGALASQNENHHYLTRFRYPSNGGFGAYVSSVSAGQEVNLEHEVVSIDVDRQRLEFSNGTTANYEELVSSMPLPELIRCVKDVPEDVATAAERLVCTSLVLVNLGIARDDGYPDAHWMYFYDDDVVFSRGAFPHKLSPSNVPEGCGSIQVEIYHSRYRPLAVQDVLNRAVEDLTRIGLLYKDDSILVANEQRVPYANVLFDLERARSLAVVQAYLDEKSIVGCGRYGEWAYLWTDDSIVSGWEAAARVMSAE